MLKVQRFINELMTSNCYLVYDEEMKHCLVIDPASKDALREIQFIKQRGLTLDYIIITHEHTDHNWGVNALREEYPHAIFICSEQCEKYIKKTNRAYFLLYYDDPSYHYEISHADKLVTQQKETILWIDREISFLLTPGHSYGSMCVELDGMLFSCDMIIPFKPYFNGRDSNKDEWMESIKKINAICSEGSLIYPGHGDSILLGDWKLQYKSFFEHIL